MPSKRGEGVAGSLVAAHPDREHQNTQTDGRVIALLAKYEIFQSPQALRKFTPSFRHLLFAQVDHERCISDSQNFIQNY